MRIKIDRMLVLGMACAAMTTLLPVQAQSPSGGETSGPVRGKVETTRPLAYPYLDHPAGVAVDRRGNVYIADTNQNRVLKVNRDGTVAVIAGNGAPEYGGDGGPAAHAQLRQPWGVAVDGGGSLYITDEGNHRVRKVNPDGIISTVAGTGVQAFSGDGYPATDARLSNPKGLAVDRHGNLLIADYGNGRVRRVDRKGIITTVAGADPSASIVDGGPAAATRLREPSAVAMDRRGQIYITERGPGRVRKVNGRGIIVTIAGGAWPDERMALLAPLHSPAGIAVDRAGNVFSLT